MSINTSAPSVVTQRDPKGRKFMEIVGVAYDKAGLSEGEAQIINSTPGLAKLITGFIKKHRPESLPETWPKTFAELRKTNEYRRVLRLLKKDHTGHAHIDVAVGAVFRKGQWQMYEAVVLSGQGFQLETGNCTPVPEEFNLNPGKRYVRSVAYARHEEIREISLELAKDALSESGDVVPDDLEQSLVQELWRKILKYLASGSPYTYAG